MARISGLILGIGLLIVISSMASPASAWDDDDDHHHHRYDRHHRHHGHYGHYGHYNGRGLLFAPIIRQPLLVPHHHAERRYYGGGYAAPYYPPAPQQTYYPPIQQQQLYYPPTPQQPIVPAPLPPEALGLGANIPPEPLPPVAIDPGADILPRPELLPVPQAPPVIPLPNARPGQFVDAAATLYPYVRVKDADNAARFGLHRIVAVQSPDPFRFPGCVYVQVCVPPGPCREVKVKHGGAKIELKYGDYEVEVTSSRGLITVDYDD